MSGVAPRAPFHGQAGDRKSGGDGRLAKSRCNIDLEAATHLNSSGPAALASVCTAPDFKREPTAVRQAHVLEIPTPRRGRADVVCFKHSMIAIMPIAQLRRGSTSLGWYTAIRTRPAVEPQ